MDHRSIKKAVKVSVRDSILINSLGGFFNFIDDSVYDSVLYTVSVNRSVYQAATEFRFLEHFVGEAARSFTCPKESPNM